MGRAVKAPSFALEELRNRKTELARLLRHYCELRGADTSRTAAKVLMCSDTTAGRIITNQEHLITLDKLYAMHVSLGNSVNVKVVTP